MDMATGTVKWFSDAKGFGFIEPDEPGADVFAHFSAIEMEGFKTLKQGCRVRYELQDGPKGPHAQGIVAESAENTPAQTTNAPIAKITTSDAAAESQPLSNTALNASETSTSATALS